MRVTQFTQYNNFLLNQQNTLNNLNEVQTQISTGVKIQNMYDDPVVFTKYLKFNEEINTFSQIKSSANFAQTFANETDTVLNDFVTTLGSFKTNLLKAANDTNDETSREAIVSELKGELDHLKDLANTSIDGKYLFSGSRFNTKPIDDNYQYQGNDVEVKAFLGAGVEREYNINGEDLFLGRDNDYKKSVSLNLPQYDKMKANPQFVVRGNDGELYIDKDIIAHGKNPDSEDVPVNEPVTGESQIRMLTGVSDIYDEQTDSYSDGTSYFYLKGKTPSGEMIDEKFSLSNSDTVNDLLEKIGEYYGNNNLSKVVDVSLNDMGEITVTDVQTGKMMSDFYLVASDADEESIDDLVSNGDYIVSFQKSDFEAQRNQSTITANNAYFDNSLFKFGSAFKTIDTKREAVGSDVVYNVLGKEGIRKSDGSVQDLSEIGLSVTDADGNVTSYAPLSIDSNTTMQDIVDYVKNSMGSDNVDVKMEDGEIVIIDKSVENKNDPSQYKSISLSAYDSGGNELEVFASKDVANFDKINFTKNSNELNSNVSQIIRDYKTSYHVDENGNIEKIVEKNPLAQTYATDDTSIIDTSGKDEVPQVLELKYRDINGELKTAKITLRDTEENGHLSTFEVDGNVYDIYEPDGSLTPAHDLITTSTSLDPTTCEICKNDTLQKGMTYRQLGDVVSMLTSGNLPAGNTADDYNEAVKTSKEYVTAGLDSKGRFTLSDKTSNPTKIDLSMYGTYTDPATNETKDTLYFQANNAVTIDQPQVDFFQTLQDAITAVENGNNYPDGDSNDPRNFGIQGAIEAIDHVTDHVRRNHAKIGAVSNEFGLAIERTDMLTLNVQQLQSENIDTDIGEASMRLNSLTTSYQALLASIAKVNNLTLLNYL